MEAICPCDLDKSRYIQLIDCEVFYRPNATHHSEYSLSQELSSNSVGSILGDIISSKSRLSVPYFWISVFRRSSIVRSIISRVFLTLQQQDQNNKMFYTDRFLTRGSQASQRPVLYLKHKYCYYPSMMFHILLYSTNKRKCSFHTSRIRMSLLSWCCIAP